MLIVLSFMQATRLAVCLAKKGRINNNVGSQAGLSAWLHTGQMDNAAGSQAGLSAWRKKVGLITM